METTGTAVARVEPAGAAVVRKTTGHHGEVRGLGVSRRSSQFEGRFGRMFRTLPPAHADEQILKKLAEAMSAEAEDQPTPETEVDDEENTGISAGYTYLGQFIDHDLTFDPASSLERQNDPDGLVDYRTPRFDLDNVYGRGPDDQPYLYRADGLHLLQGEPLTGNDDDPKARDLPRITPQDSTEPVRAVIGDPRNDENVIVSQLQSNMIRFHNRMVAVLNSKDFEHVQRNVRWHYQWVVLHDFLPTVIGLENWQEIFGNVKPGTPDIYPKLKFFHVQKEAFMPVEFSVAAYRFGHSMVRPIYRLNQTIDRLPIFSLKGESLAGFRRFPRNWAIDWRLFFNSGNNPPPTGKTRVQPAYKIDSSLVNPLSTLPPSVASNPSSLPERNLLRGFRMQLPSGQSVARAMGMDPIPDEQLKVGKANESDTPTNKKITDISPRFANNAPLWFYVLAEAQQQFKKNDTPIHLGPVGGRIVGEVIAGLLLEDSHSYLRLDPKFKPNPKLAGKNGEFKMANLLEQAKQA
ncbi:MAG TPA: heme peroxidase family protein [Terriglobales bacterium]|nr:heme peroxidase family protein [Terriglobales bacterium]